VLLLLWPWMWFDPIARFKEYFAFHLHHVYYNFEFLGRNYNKPPFPKSFAFISTLLTVPVTTLALALVGLIAVLFGSLIAARRRRADEAEVARGEPPPPPPPLRVWRAHIVGVRELPDPPARWRAPAVGFPTAPGLLVVLNVFFPLAIIAFTGAPIFGGVKHFL